METDFELALRSDPALLSAVRRLVRQYAEDQGVGRDKLNEVVLAVDEACTNAIRHAYGNRDDRSLVLTMRSGDDFIEFMLQDSGETAPSERVARRPVVPPDPEELMPGGLGIQLIYEAFDDVSFLAANPHGNRVVMRLHRQMKAEG